MPSRPLRSSPQPGDMPRRRAGEPTRVASSTRVSAVPILRRGEWAIPGPHPRTHSGLSCTPGGLRPRGRGPWESVQRRRVEPRQRRPPGTRHLLNMSDLNVFRIVARVPSRKRALHRCGPNGEWLLRLGVTRRGRSAPGGVIAPAQAAAPRTGRALRGGAPRRGAPPRSRGVPVPVASVGSRCPGPHRRGDRTGRSPLGPVDRPPHRQGRTPRYRRPPGRCRCRTTVRRHGRSPRGTARGLDPAGATGRADRHPPRGSQAAGRPVEAAPVSVAENGYP